jgi:MFS family permease
MTRPTGASTPGFRSNRGVVVTALGLTQILAWGSSYYLLAVLAKPIAIDTGWPLTWVVGGLSAGLIVAGVVSPFVGRAINGGHGRGVMATSSALLAIGLLALALASHIAVYFVAWVLVGAGMGAGLYDAAFATLGRLYRGEARRLIAALTLFGGLASTVCWPLSAFLLENLGWRGACLVYASIQLLFALPLYLIALPAAPPRESRSAANGEILAARALVSNDEMTRFVLLTIAISLAAMISTVVSVHLLTILQARGIALSSAVALGALVGPSQVLARFIEMSFHRYFHPIWTKLAATSLVAGGLGLMTAGFPILAIPLVLYGAGIGIESIARGTLPLAIFDPAKYAAIMGRIAMPSLIGQAIAPTAGAFLIEYGGSHFSLGVLSTLAVLNVFVVIILMRTCRAGGTV